MPANRQNPSPVRTTLACVVTTAAVTACALLPSTAAAARPCPQLRAGSGYAGGVLRVLRAKQDVWGNELIARPNGPTYAAVRRLLKPLLFAKADRRPLTVVGDLLPAVRAAARRPRCNHRRAARRGRQRDPLPDRGRAEPEGLRRTLRAGALRLVPRPARLAAARRRVPADARDRVRGLLRHPLPPGVVRRPRARHRSARQLREGEGGRRPSLGRGRPARPERARARQADDQHAEGERPRRAGRAARPLRRVAPPGARLPARADRRRDVRGGRDRLVDFWHARLGAEPMFDVPEQVVVNASEACSSRTSR